MAKLLAISLLNYRRFAGEVEIPLDPGVNIVLIPPGMGKTTILEAVAWCLMGNEMVSDPTLVPNVDALDHGLTEVNVALTFVNGERLERFAQFASGPEEVVRQSWGWRLRRVSDGSIIREGNDEEEFSEHQERLFPEACVHANLISGPDLSRTLKGGRSGPERAVQCSDNWCTSDLSLRCSMEATGLFHRMSPDAQVDILDYDPEGRLELSLCGPLSEEDVHLAILSHALAFSRENARVCPLLLDDPLGEVGLGEETRLYAEIIDLLPMRQLIFLLASFEQASALRSTGRVDKELEIRG